jgi:tetratricopeptide (TPR) repeat protein
MQPHDLVPPEAKPNVTRLARALQELQQARAALAADAAEAISLLRKVIQDYPGTGEASDARLDLAKALAQTGDTAGAVREAGLVADNPKEERRQARAFLLRADILAPSDPEAARRDLERVLAGFRDARDLQAKADLALGLLDLKAGHIERALERLARVTRRPVPEQDDAEKLILEAVAAKAKTLSDQGDWQAVADWCAKMAARFPDLVLLRHSLRFREAVACRHLGRFAEARNLVERLLRDVPKEVLSADIHLPEELDALTKAEEAAGIRRTREAFLRAKADGKETRASFEGDLTADTAWGKSRGPLVLTGLATVKPGVRLTVEPGAVVQFVLGARLVVEGTLLAAGTAQDPVRFTSAAGDAASCFDGEGIEIAASAPADASRLEHAIVSNQRVGLTCRKSSPALLRCTFTRNGKEALSALADSEPSIEDCTFEGNDGAAIHTDRANAAVRRCRITRNGQEGVALYGKSAPTVEACRIAANGGDGVACDNFVAATIRDNEIASNGGDGVSCNRYSNATVQGNILRENAKMGIRCTRDSSATIVGNLIEANVVGGINLDQSGGTIRDNTVVRGKSYGINCANNSSPVLQGNWIEGNYGSGIICGLGSSPTITGNAIVGHRYAVSNFSGNQVKAPDNYYGEVSDSDMSSHIFDKDPAPQNLVWRPRLTAPPPRPPRPSPPSLP